MTLNVEKTHITHVNDGFVFLGHRIVRKKSSRGHWRPVTAIPRESVRRLTHRLTDLLSSNYDMDSHRMVVKLNQIISGWTAFYGHAMYASRIYGKLDSIVFWKFGHWLARKYRTRVNELMRKWYGYSKVYGRRTWMLHKTVDGRRVSVTLTKFAWTQRNHFVSPRPKANPFLEERQVTAGGGHHSYSHIALLTEA